LRTRSISPASLRKTSKRSGHKVYRARIRSAYSDDELKNLYRNPHNHAGFHDHILRVKATIAVAQWLGPLDTAADLSAGDATVINSLTVGKKFIGDIAPGYEITGPIEETIDLIPAVDLFICSETLEHIDNPEFVLSAIRSKAKHLLLTTPDGETQIGNPEHYWGWDSECIKNMLVEAGFEPMCLSLIKLREYGYAYDYQIWLAKASEKMPPSPSRSGK
jgi:hypothetical protein